MDKNIFNEKIIIPKKHHETTRVALIAAAGLGPLGAFTTVADVAAIAGVWTGCLVSIAYDEGIKLDKDAALKICKSSLLGMGGYYAGCKTATKFFHLIPGAGTLTAMGVSALANILFTYRFVLTLCSIFRNKGKNFDADTLVENIVGMFHGNGILNDAKEIVRIYRNK